MTKSVHHHGRHGGIGLFIMWEKSENWALDEVLAEQGLTRHVALTMASFEQSFSW